MFNKNLGLHTMAEQSEGHNGMNIAFRVGDMFSSFDELDLKLKRFEHTNFMQFWKWDARTFEAAKKHVERFLKPELKYYEIKYCCIHGWQAFKPKGKGT